MATIFFSLFTMIISSCKQPYIELLFTCEIFTNYTSIKVEELLKAERVLNLNNNKYYVSGGYRAPGGCSRLSCLEIYFGFIKNPKIPAINPPEYNIFIGGLSDSLEEDNLISKVKTIWIFNETRNKIWQSDVKKFIQIKNAGFEYNSAPLGMIDNYFEDKLRLIVLIEDYNSKKYIQTKLTPGFCSGDE